MLNNVLDRIEARLKAVDLSATAASLAAGLSRDAIRNIRRSVQKPGSTDGASTRTITALATPLKTTAAWLLEGHGPEEIGGEATETVKVPVLSMVSAGAMLAQEAVLEPESHLYLTGLPPGDWVGLTVDGDSMDRIAPHGAKVIANRRETRAVNGAFFVVQDPESGSATFKRYIAKPKPTLAPFSTNPDNLSMTVDGDFTIYGRVRRVITDL